MKRIRMFVRICVESFLGIWHSGWQNLFIISTIMLMLLSFGVVLSFSLSLKKFANLLGSDSGFLVYIKSSVDPNIFEEKLKNTINVDRVKLMPREEAVNDLHNILGFDIGASSTDFPNGFEVRVKDNKKILNTLEDIARVGANDIEHIEYAQDLIHRIQIGKNIMLICGTLFSLLLAITTFIINFNTIELVIRSRRNEIKLLNFMGVSSWFIKGPFIMQGIFYAFAGSSLGILLLSIILGIAGKSLDSPTRYFFVPNNFEFFLISVILILTAIVCSASSSLWATETRINKY